MVKTRQRKGHPGWQVDLAVTFPSGERYRERRQVHAPTRTAARLWGEQRQAVLLAQGGPENCDRSQNPPTLAAFQERFLEEYVRANRQKPSSAASAECIIRSRLVPTLGAKRLDEIGPAEVQAVKASLANLSPKSVNNTLSQLSRMLRYASEVGLLREDRLPAVRWLKAPKSASPRFYGFDDYRRLLAAARALDPRIELLVLLGGDAGLRRGEAIALEWPDVDLDRRTLHVQRSEWDGQVTAPKGGRSRRVPLTAALFEALRAYRHLRGARVLYKPDGGTVGKKAVKVWMKQAERRAGLEVTGGYHVLRHTFCSHLAMLGAPAKAIQELAGHADLGTTLRYMHLSPGARESALGLLDGRGNVTQASPDGRIMQKGQVVE